MLTEQEHRNRRLAAELLSRYQHNDHDGILGLLTDDCVFNIGAGKSQGIVPYHGVHDGHEKISGYLRKRRANVNRDECLIKPAASGATPHQEQSDGSDTQWNASNMPTHERLVVYGSVVVAIGHLKDSFNDGKPMHETDFAIVFQIDQEQNKIRGFHYILDSEGVADAWRKKHDPAVQHAGGLARGS